eukprot:TRINITY_DN11619_c0_g1_i9.p1 TRINITY_DN11619_c0_g1~~TRINITY_DN11619_c0_g1_i9.p1  ORF type:complete len:156 (+),score=17.35 TRINITY_DN11619_c0_g1_i9:164-631(+)
MCIRDRSPMCQSEVAANCALRWGLARSHAWLAVRHPSPSKRIRPNPHNPVVVQEFEARNRTIPEWFDEFLQASQHFTVPVIIRGGLHTLTALETLKLQLHSECAELKTGVGVIPYAGTFLGNRGAEMSWQQYRAVELPGCSSNWTTLCSGWILPN